MAQYQKNQEKNINNMENIIKINDNIEKNRNKNNLKIRLFSLKFLDSFSFSPFVNNFLNCFILSAKKLIFIFFILVGFLILL